MNSNETKRLNHIALALLFYTLLVIVWGAWVRISHSGDGCGQSWPLCDGEFIPSTAGSKVWTEYFHRVMSGVYGIFVVGIFIWVRTQARTSAVRRASASILVLTITEALLGAKLVLFGLVGQNDSYFRVAIMAFHQLNSFLLMGATFLLFKVSMPERGQDNQPRKSEKTNSKSENFLFIFKNRQSILLFVILIIAMTGSWASLSNTLYPGDGLLEGLMKDFSQDAHHLVRLRVFHPVLATLFCTYMMVSSWIKYQYKSQNESLAILFVFLTALMFGWMTLIFHAPVWMKITHLMLAHGVWVYTINLVYDWTQRGELRTGSVH